MEAAEEADLNHEYNASLVVSPLGSGCQAGWLCPTPTAAGAAAVQGAEQQLLHLCPCAMLRPGSVSEVFAPAPEAHRDGTGTGRRKLRADEDAMDYKPSVSRGQQNGASTEGGQGQHPGCWASWLLSVTVVNTTAKSNSWRKEFITLTHHSHSPSRREAKIGN